VESGHHTGLSALPAVHELAARLDVPRADAVAAARRAIDEQRERLRDGGDAVPIEILMERARAHLQPSLRRVINATGVIIHTNLGRAPLSAAARDAVAAAAHGYSNLELDLGSGERGSRHDHVAKLLCDLTGAQDAIVVNNGAGAVLLAAAALAGASAGDPPAIVVSRGQLVEIGGGFRIPDVIAQAGATMVEVGTTNRTRLADYERALGMGGTASILLRVHQSNFRTLGFVSEVAIEELCGLGVPVIDDVGSGALADGVPAFADEPSLRRSIAAGAALVCCSGDKLLGGPQAGLLLGTTEAIAVARAHPLARALRIDKLSLAALEATLALYRDPARARLEIPVLEMLERSPATLDAMARRLGERIGPPARVVPTVSRVGGGALPLTELPGPAVALDGDPVALAAALRDGDPPVVARIHDGEVLLDPRTLAEDELESLADAARRALARP
jgi:L-seryl-tRNA(Ser) seleniumtransferase